MSRSLVLGNGNILLLFDRNGQLRDFYYPYAGLENHVGSGNIHKIGVWIEGAFSWLSDPGWNISVDYASETLVGSIVADNSSLKISLFFTDVVYNEKNIFIRRVEIKNNDSKERNVRVFFNQQFQISETTHADTVYFNPSINAIIQYKGRRVFLVGGEANGEALSEWSCGIYKIEGKEGTWRDAEDGILSKNPIEHGSVDSTLGFNLTIGAGQSRIVHYWIAVSETFREVAALQDYLIKKTPDHLIQTTRDFWHAWVNKYHFTFYGLSEDVVKLFKKSLFVIRTHCDNNGGILASGDSDNYRYGRDTYAYVWPRDGSLVATALDRTGFFDIAHRFYEFCRQVLTEDGYLLHKYQPDKSFGSSWHPWISKGKSQLAIQEDETALLIWSLWGHYEKNRDLEYIESLYNFVIKGAADFMIRYREGFSGKLPFPSYDLWEEKNAISTFTAASVYGALSAAAKFAAVLGKTDEEKRYKEEAQKIKEAIITYLYNPSNEYFHKLLYVENDKLVPDSTIDIASFYGVFRFGVLAPDDPKLKRAFEVLSKTLHDTIPTGGYARYQGDAYYQITSDVPGNPWFITTLWMTQYKIATATKWEELAKVNDDLMWVVKRAQKSGILSEQIHPLSGEQIAVSPLTWSHGEFVITVIDYLEKLEKLGICSVCYPLRQQVAQ